MMSHGGRSKGFAVGSDVSLRQCKMLSDRSFTVWRVLQRRLLSRTMVRAVQLPAPPPLPPSLALALMQRPG
jgi:hypothetical protein